MKSVDVCCQMDVEKPVCEEEDKPILVMAKERLIMMNSHRIIDIYPRIEKRKFTCSISFLFVSLKPLQIQRSTKKWTNVQSEL